MLFLIFLMRSDFIGDLPQRFQSVAIMTLVIFIPLVVALNEISSFIGISHRMPSHPIFSFFLVYSSFYRLTVSKDRRHWVQK